MSASSNAEMGPPPPLLSTKRKGNLYKVRPGELSNQKVSCLLSIKENHWLWHKKPGHANWRLISSLQKNNLVKGLPCISYKDDLLCEACKNWKQVKNSFSSKNVVSTSRPLELLHLDLFDPTWTASTTEKRYKLVIEDSYSRGTWVMFLSHKDDSFNVFFKFCKRIHGEKIVCITPIISNHRGEFESENFQLICEENGILHNFSTLRTPQ